MMFKKLIIGICFVLLHVNLIAQNIADKIQVRWKLVETAPSKANPVSRLTLVNLTNESLSCQGWSLWFNFMRRIDPKSIDPKFSITHRNGDLYELEFKNTQLQLPAKGTFEIDFVTLGTIPNYTDAPAGLYVLGKEGKSVETISNYVVEPVVFSREQTLQNLSAQYEENTRLELNNKQQLIIPQPLSVKTSPGKFTLTPKTTLWADAMLSAEKDYLNEFMKNTFGFSFSSADKQNASIKLMHNPKLEAEEYSLNITDKQIEIHSSTSTGAFYALQSVKNLIKGDVWGNKLSSLDLPLLSVKDKPRFGYRGVMVDVARNFHNKQSILKIIDVMAMYKLNTLHLHLNDDEGWRLQIPTLPELTEVGSRRSVEYFNGLALQPGYGSGAKATEQSFYTESDFVEILKYAAKNHISIIPELETPGHARAAIKSMEMRYRKFMAKGNQQEAEKYLLNDFGDQSVYSSAQHWNDNVMNVAMPSTYRFISLVIDEIGEMYRKAGLKMKTIHLGGDEVPRGAWERSPKIRTLMDSLKITSVHEVWPYYIAKVADLCASKNVALAGWEEMGMVNKGKGMETNPALAKKNIQVDVWNNLIGGKQEDLAYKLANAGYKVVFASANNFYLDLAWKNTYTEPGHTWAGFTNIYKSYSFLPSNYYLTVYEDSKGKKVEPSFFDKKEKLTAKGKENLIGIKAAIWTEKVTTGDRLEYMLFPRVLALAERAWRAETDWEKSGTYNKVVLEKEYASFMNKLGNDELKKLAQLNGGYNFRLPAIGAKIMQNNLVLNTEYPGFDVYYTINGSEPKKYDKPIAYDKSKIYKFKVVQGKREGVETVIGLD